MLCWPGRGSEAWRRCKLGVRAAQGSLEKGDALASSINWQSPGDGQAGAFLPQRPSDWWAVQPRGDRFYLPGSVWLVRACVSAEATRIPPSAESDVLDVGHQLPPSGSFSELNSLTEGVLNLFTF